MNHFNVNNKIKFTCKIVIAALALTIATMGAVAAPAPSPTPVKRTYELPDLGNPTAQTLTPQEERKLGKEFMEEVRRSVYIIEDPITEEYIQKLGQRLAKRAITTATATTESWRKFRFFVVQDPTINAFAGPDGYIGINSGLILATRNESELAAILAHEIAHITQHHLERSLKQANVLNIPMAAVAIAALVIGGGTGSGAAASAATGAMLGTMAGGVQHMINYTRTQEAEADHVSIEILHKAGFDAGALPGFFTRMQRANLDYANVNSLPPYLRTHPVTTERIADAENRVNQYKKSGASAAAAITAQDRHYFLVHARLRYALQPNSRNTINYFKTQLDDSRQSEQEQNAARYGYALALMRDHQWPAATNNIDLLIKSAPNESIYQMLKAQLQIATKQADAAAATLKSAYTANPNYYPLSLQYARTLSSTKQPQEAQVILKQQLSNQTANSGDKTATYATLAASSANAGKLPEAYLYRAKALKAAGYYRDARILLQQALQMKNLSTNMRAILQDELNIVKSIIND